MTDLSMENLLRQKEDSNNNLITTTQTTLNTPMIGKQQANKTADLDDFIRMVGEIVSKTMKKNNVIFCPDEGARIKTDQSKKIEHSYIYFKIIDATPKGELKPRQRDELRETHDVDKKYARKGSVWGQKFKCIVQFNLFACDYTTADKVMKDFEELIFIYTAYFKKNGVAEILFQRRMTDEDLDEYRQSLSVRSLRYYVEVEKLYPEFETEIEDITVE